MIAPKNLVRIWKCNRPQRCPEPIELTRPYKDFLLRFAKAGYHDGFVVSQEDYEELAGEKIDKSAFEFNALFFYGIHIIWQSAVKSGWGIPFNVAGYAPTPRLLSADDVLSAFTQYHQAQTKKPARRRRSKRHQPPATAGRRRTMDEMDEDTTVCGATVRHDASGVGHCWRTVSRDEIPVDVLTEIECEIIDGKKEACDDYVATNGEHYCWS